MKHAKIFASSVKFCKNLFREKKVKFLNKKMQIFRAKCEHFWETKWENFAKKIRERKLFMWIFFLTESFLLRLFKTKYLIKMLVLNHVP